MDTDIDLRLKGKLVSRCCVDPAGFHLEFLENGFRTDVRISGQMNIDYQETRMVLSAIKLEEAGRACILQGKTVSESVGDKDGSLTVSFIDGSRLFVHFDDKYEAWELSASDGFLVVSTPGGGLAVWSPVEPTSKV